MLIRSLRAENFMRFASLQLMDLPDEGLIGIEGPNESGKSTIGEAVLFAFFGRTRLAGDSPVSGLIRWGAEAMSVEVEFSVASSGAAESGLSAPRRDYLLFREVDRCGTNYVKCVELPSRREVAAGNIQVADFVARQVGFDFTEFQQSFYHVQSEPCANHASQVAFFESATGVKHLREAMEALQRDLEPMEREFSFCEKEIARNLSQMEKHGHNVAKLPELTGRLAKTAELEEQSNRRIKDLRRRLEGLRAEMAGLEGRARKIEGLAAATLEAMLPELESLRAEEATSAEARAPLAGEDGSNRVYQLRDEIQGILSCLQEVSTLRQRVEEELGYSTGSLQDGQSSPAASRAKLDVEEQALARSSRRNAVWAGVFLTWAVLTSALAEHCLRNPSLVRGTFSAAGAWLQDVAPWGLVGLAALGLVLSGLQLRKRAASRRRRHEIRALRLQFDEEESRLSKDAEELRRLLKFRGGPGIAGLVAGAASASNRRIAEVAKALSAKHPQLLGAGGKSGLEEAFLKAAKMAREIRSRHSSEAHRVEKQIQEESSAVKKLQAEKEKAENEMRECQSQAVKKEGLESRNAELELSAARIRGEMDLRLLACRLLEETIGAIREKVGPGLTDLVKVLLPRLTAGRYRDVRVGSALEVLVYSSEKNDFLSLVELSGGTHEALGLALRLAISQALVSARIRQAQFAFLDEPFKMMDELRVKETLRVLTRLSPDLRQVFVSQPEFTPDQRKLFRQVIRTTREATSLSSSGAPGGVEGDLAAMRGEAAK